jgi:hypothetical protein
MNSPFATERAEQGQPRSGCTGAFEEIAPGQRAGVILVKHKLNQAKNRIIYK